MSTVPVFFPIRPDQPTTMSTLPSPIRFLFPKPQTLTPIPKPFFLSKPFSSIAITSHSKPTPPNSTFQTQTSSPLPPNLHSIISLFQSVPDPKAKYHQLLHYASSLPPLPSHYKTDRHRVRGCVSQVWVRAFRDEDGTVRFEADSDSALTKGLAGLLVEGLSGASVAEIAAVSPEFVTLLGLKQSLTPSRNNGFLNMLRLMQQKALELEIEDSGWKDSSFDEQSGVSNEKESTLNAQGGVLGGKDSSFDEQSGVSDEKDSTLNAQVGVLGGKDSIFDEQSGGSDGEDVNGGISEVAESGISGGLGSRGERIRAVLEKELSPVELEVEDISYQHAGHAGVRGSGDGETHFNLRIVSKEFEGKSMVKRHRLVYGLLQEELDSGLHALSIVAKTPSEV